MTLRFLSTSIIALTAAAGAHTLAAAETTLGFVNANARVEGSFRGVAKNAWTSGAIFVPASTLRSLQGCRITSVKVMLASKNNLDALNVWIAPGLDSDKIVEQEAAQIARGWNEVVLASPLTIGDGFSDGIYIGYSIHQTGASNAVANTADSSIGGLFTNIDGNGWRDGSAEGSLCVLATVEGESVPASNLAISGISTNLIHPIGQTTAKGRIFIKNLGTEAVDSFTLKSAAGNSAPSSQDVSLAIAPGKVAAYDFEVPAEFAAEGRSTISYTVGNLSADADPADNTVEADVAVVAEPIVKTLVIEEFTTERCVNCPSGATTIAKHIQQNADAFKAVVVCHHSGFSTDWLTLDADKDYLWFFNSADTYAPAVMIDRATDPLGDTPVGMVTATLLNQMSARALTGETTLRLDARATLDGNRLAVEVDGTTYDGRLGDNPAITVYLIENKVKPKNQSGASDGYLHNHVTRALNATWGEPVKPDADGRFNYATTFDLNSDWNSNNLEIVALVHASDPDNQRNWRVANAVQLSAPEFATTALPGIEAADDAPATYFTPDGRAVGSSQALPPGIYLMVKGSQRSMIVVR